MSQRSKIANARGYRRYGQWKSKRSRLLRNPSIKPVELRPVIRGARAAALKPLLLWLKLGLGLVGRAIGE